MRSWAKAVGVVIIAVSGCAPRELQEPEQLTLLSIDGRWNERGGWDSDCRSVNGTHRCDHPDDPYTPPAGASATERFHGYPVLGKVEVMDPEERKRLVAALKVGLSSKQGMAKCFCPRHAIRAVQGGRVYEYLICFECAGVLEYLDGEQKRAGGFDTSVHPAFDEPLVKDGIPIAP
jgi:hypothetical protein